MFWPDINLNLPRDTLKKILKYDGIHGFWFLKKLVHP